MEVTFDPAKNEINIRKHGVSQLKTENFDLDTAFHDVDDSQDYGEARYNVLGWLEALLHALTFTQDGEAIRAISLRRATRQEQMTYNKES